MTAQGRRWPTAGAVIWRAGAGIALALLLLLVGLPVLALVLRTPPGELLRRLGDPVVLQALRLSVVTSAIATLIVVLLGLPAAYLLAVHRFPGRRLLEALVELPMVLPRRLPASGSSSRSAGPGSSAARSPRSGCLFRLRPRP